MIESKGVLRRVLLARCCARSSPVRRIMKQPPGRIPCSWS